MLKKLPIPIPAPFITSIDKGINTISPKYKRLKPIVIPKPGITLLLLPISNTPILKIISIYSFLLITYLFKEKSQTFSPSTVNCKL
jgi:hypothetical protein